MWSLEQQLVQSVSVPVRRANEGVSFANCLIQLSANSKIHCKQTHTNLSTLYCLLSLTNGQSENDHWRAAWDLESSSLSPRVFRWLPSTVDWLAIVHCYLIQPPCFHGDQGVLLVTLSPWRPGCPPGHPVSTATRVSSLSPCFHGDQGVLLVTLFPWRPGCPPGHPVSMATRVSSWSSRFHSDQEDSLWVADIKGCDSQNVTDKTTQK